jgi:urease accessory protein UreH
LQQSLNGYATNCSLKPERVGRDGFLSVSFGRRAERTVVARSRFSLPLQILSPAYLEDGSAWVMLLNPTGGG